MCGAADVTRDRERRGTRRHRLAERDGEGRVLRHVDRVRPRDRARHGGCGVGACRAEVLRVTRLRAGEVGEVVFGVLRAADPLERVVAVRRGRVEPSAFAARALRRADAVDDDGARDQPDARKVVGCEVGDAGPVRLVRRDGTGVPGACGIGEEIRLPRSEHNACAHRRPGGGITGGAGSAALEDPARDVDSRRAGVPQLDELVVSSDGTASAELGDDDAARRRHRSRRAPHAYERNHRCYRSDQPQSKLSHKNSSPDVDELPRNGPGPLGRVRGDFNVSVARCQPGSRLPHRLQAYFETSRRRRRCEQDDKACPLRL